MPLMFNRDHPFWLIRTQISTRFYNTAENFSTYRHLVILFHSTVSTAVSSQWQMPEDFDADPEHFLQSTFQPPQPLQTPIFIPTQRYHHALLASISWSRNAFRHKPGTITGLTSLVFPSLKGYRTILPIIHYLNRAVSQIFV